VFPARYELNSYIVFRKRLVSKRLIFVANVGVLIFNCILLVLNTVISDIQSYILLWENF
jgi:hypothetical protein